jgi:hypothetical protein
MPARKRTTKTRQQPAPRAPDTLSRGGGGGGRRRFRELQQDPFFDDPYPDIPRNLVVKVANPEMLRKAYHDNPDMIPWNWLVDQDPDLRAVLPDFDSFLLFTPTPPIPPGIDDDLFSFLAFRFPNLPAAQNALAILTAYQPKKRSILSGTYIQGQNRSPSLPPKT